MINYAITILILPLLSFIVQIFIGKRLPRKGDWVSIGAVAITLCLSLSMFGVMLVKYDPDFSIDKSWIWFIERWRRF